MIIKRITVKNFGKLKNRTMELSPGINLLYGENESGKTTTHTFVKSMLYGIQRQRGRAAKRMPIIFIFPGKILDHMEEPCGLKTVERISALPEIFIKKMPLQNCSARMTERSWM